MKSYSEYRALARETLTGRWNTMAGLSLLMMVIGSGLGFTYVGPLLVTVPLSYAFYNLCLACARGENVEGYCKTLFREFADNWGTYVGTGFLVCLIVIAVAIPTLCIASIIFGLAYALVPFIIRENPNLGVIAVMKQSRIMMRGHKWELFVLQLTFIGWAFLAILSCGIGFFWLTPYMNTSIAHFYEDVKAEYEAQQAPTLA